MPSFYLNLNITHNNEEMETIYDTEIDKEDGLVISMNKCNGALPLNRRGRRRPG